METIETLLSVASAKAQHMTRADMLEVVFVGLSVIGQHFIAKRDKRGFYFWLVANGLAIVLFLALERYPTVMLYCYFLYSSFAGLVRWTVAEDDEARARQRQPAESAMPKVVSA